MMTSSNGNIFRVTVNSPHKGQWRGGLMFSLICARINGWINNCEAGDLRRNRAHYDVSVMMITVSSLELVKAWQNAIISQNVWHHSEFGAQRIPYNWLIPSNSSVISLPQQTFWTRERLNFKSLKSNINWDNRIWNDTEHPGDVKSSSQTWFSLCIPSKHAYWWYKIVLCIDTLSKLVFCCGFPSHRMVVVGSRFSVSKWWLKKCHANNIQPTGCSTYSHDFTACFDHATCFQTL